ncbi:GNAT family N-acetyltransferase [Jatrophihabitans telluris]|uniref:GNAT family N-acetyltransferase n=1 Tax=Jatrophihabitans telluris TaxID=2038343 RepID=A0ABY4QUI5_9ACTN|nr:GNAT family N-acetyltransferase [Jatrophihabitans telluris]UQX86912.1 GNAT family N-acetyltransferase [Jatrophihabitans telluris]
MSTPTLTFSVAEADDAGAVADLVRSAYRGDSSRQGWTTEADLLSDDRIDAIGVLAKISDPNGVVLLGRGDDGALLTCCEVLHRGDQLGYFGMFAVQPTAQGGGIGRLVLDEAERFARQRWGVATMEMTVIGQRGELIAWYLRRGYRRTGERRAFPYEVLAEGQALRDDLYFEVLTKPLSEARPS